MSKVTIVVGALVSLFLQDVENPVYKSWAKFKAGTKVTIKTESEAAGNKTQMESTYELKSVDDKEAVVSVSGSMVAMGNKIDMPARDEKHPAKVKKVEGNPDKKPKTEEGDEEVEVGGKKVKCHWVKVTMEQGTSKVWSSDEVPGNMVKVESEMGGAKTRIWVAALETK